jgi:solute carrier family 25 (adenine nucleotide translocator) protein 4/5/6/31
MFQKMFHYHHKFTAREHFYINFAIGISSSIIVSFTLYPLEYIRQQLSNRVDKNGIGIWQQFKKTINKNGFRGLYKGAHIFLLGLLLFRGTYFGLYDSLKVTTDDTFVRWWFAYISMFAGILVSYPGDTIRRRIVSSRGKYDGLISCFNSIWKKEGVRGIFLGWHMIWFQSLTGCTLYYFYDKLFTDYA